MRQQFAKGGQRRRLGARQGRRVGGDPVQGAQQDRQAGRLGLAIPVAVRLVAPAPGGFMPVGPLVLGPLAFALAVPFRQRRLRFRPHRRRTPQPQFQRSRHPHGEEATVEQPEIFQFARRLLRPLRLTPKRHAQPIGALAQLQEHCTTGIGAGHLEQM